jgi:rod shape-determining protein MreC
LGGIERRFDNLSSYLSLVQENKELDRENARLYNQLPSTYYNPISSEENDTSKQKKYVYMPARVINNSTNKQYNFIILDKGWKHGLEPEMAVVGSDGIVGMVKETSEHYSSVVSVLNREFFPNAMIKRNGYFGPIEWSGKHYRKVILSEIPLHVDVQVGDTIVTSGYSSIFPPGILIGTVESFKPEKGIFYEIKVDLSTDFKNLSNVMVIKNLMREEQAKLEENIEHD